MAIAYSGSPATVADNRVMAPIYPPPYSSNEVATSLSRHYFQYYPHIFSLFTFLGQHILRRYTPPLVAPNQTASTACAHPFFSARVLRLSRIAGRGEYLHQRWLKWGRDDEAGDWSSGEGWRKVDGAGWGGEVENWTAELKDGRFTTLGKHVLESEFESPPNCSFQSGLYTRPKICIYFCGNKAFNITGIIITSYEMIEHSLTITAPNQAVLIRSTPSRRIYPANPRACRAWKS